MWQTGNCRRKASLRISGYSLLRGMQVAPLAQRCMHIIPIMGKGGYQRTGTARRGACWGLPLAWRRSGIIWRGTSTLTIYAGIKKKRLSFWQGCYRKKRLSAWHRGAWSLARGRWGTAASLQTAVRRICSRGLI